MSSRKVTQQSTCEDLFSYEQRNLLCNRCTKVMDITKAIRARNTARTKPCFRLWDEKWASLKELNLVLKHCKIYEELSLAQYATIENESKYKISKEESIIMGKK